MSEIKRPRQHSPGDFVRDVPVYEKSEADAYITALERRARIAERLSQKLYPTTGMLYYGKLAADAESEIDAELAKEQAK